MKNDYFTFVISSRSVKNYESDLGDFAVVFRIVNNQFNDAPGNK